MPVPLGTGVDRFLGQSRSAALCDQRLLSPPPAFAARHRER